jgi:hypothetical protein
VARDGLASHETDAWCREEPCEPSRKRWEVELADFVARYPSFAERLEAILRGEIEGARERLQNRARPRALVFGERASDPVRDELWDAADRGAEHLEPEIRARGVELIRAKAYLG